MTRRDASWLIARAAATAGAASSLAPWLAANQGHRHGGTAPPDPHTWTAYQPRFFSAEEFEWLEAFTSILIPTDETPGAREAHVADFIDFVINAAAEYAPEVQDHWRNGMQWLRSSGFGKLTAEQQTALITAAAAPETDHSAKHAGFAAYQLIKEMTVRAFYTSRVGLVDVLEYQGIAYLTEFPACTHPEHRQI